MPLPQAQPSPRSSLGSEDLIYFWTRTEAHEKLLYTDSGKSSGLMASFWEFRESLMTPGSTSNTRNLRLGPALCKGPGGGWLRADRRASRVLGPLLFKAPCC